jgi:4-amino-4-deoxy-L-arabinose transferase-like glycosyltransferase
MQTTQESLGSEESLFAKTIKQTRFERDRWLRIDIELGSFLLLLGIIFAIRIHNINYNTPFADEAIYVTVGEEALSGIYTQNAPTWMFGSYIYPAIAAITNHLAGITGLRILSAVLSTITAVFIFLGTAHLFSRQAALWATLIFGLTGSAINMGQFAVMDALAIPLLAMALYSLVTADPGMKRGAHNYLLAAAICFSLSVLTKYISILYLPAFVLIGLALYMSQGRFIGPVITLFLCPVIFILGAYLAYYLVELAVLITSRPPYVFDWTGDWGIVQALWVEIGGVMLIVLLTVAMKIVSWRQIFFAKTSAQTKPAVLLSFSFISLLGLSILAAPLYHLATGNSQALWQHSLYSLVFLAPLAGYGVATIVSQIRSRRGQWATYYRIIGATITVVGLVWYVNYGLNRYWGFQHSWPDVSGVVKYVASRGLAEDDHVLAEGAQIYEYYSDLDVKDRADRWNSTWYMEYDGRQGVDAMRAAISDHWFDFVILDDYYDPGIVENLEGVLTTAGYLIGYEESQALSTGKDIHLRVYILPEHTGAAN